MEKAVKKRRKKRPKGKKKTIVMSLGGSLIMPSDKEKIDVSFLKEFKKIIRNNSDKYNFVIVCGGGNLAREYISALSKENIKSVLQDLAGVSATRSNARFISYFFNKEPEEGIPHKIKCIKKYLKKQNIVFCGALQYRPKMTTDANAAEIVRGLKTASSFVNITNIDGLYEKDPDKYPNAKFIPKISWKEFHKIASKKEFKPGQHFVLDQTSSKIIKNNKIPTYILGSDLKQLSNFLNKKDFKGTTIKD